MARKAAPPKKGTWVDCRGNVRTPSQEFHADDGRVVYGQAAIRAAMRWIGGKRPLGRVIAMIRPRERSAARRRAMGRSTTSGSDPGEPGEPEPLRRRITVDDHYLVVAVVG